MSDLSEPPRVERRRTVPQPSAVAHAKGSAARLGLRTAAPAAHSPVPTQDARPAVPLGPVPPRPSVPSRPSVPPRPGFSHPAYLRVATTTVPVRQPIWPSTSTGGAAPYLLGLAVVAGAAAATAIPLDRPGAGWLVAGLLIAGLIAVAARRIATDERDARQTGAEPVGRMQRLGWGAATVALLAVGTVRDSGWLFTLCVLAACGTGSLAVAGGRSVRGLLTGTVALPVVSVRCLPWVARGVRRLRGNGTGTTRLLASAGVGLLLLVVFGALFGSADAAFASVLEAVTPKIDGGSVVRWTFLFTAAALGTLGACHLLLAPMPGPAPAERTPRTWRLPEWALPVVLLVLLFTAFVIVQLTVLFGGRDYMLRTAGLTAAEYARSGFSQLVVVTLLTLVVIGAVAYKARTDAARDRIWLRVLLGALAVLTLVIVASALTRMWAYQQSYGFTVLRLLVQTFELWLGSVYLLVIAAGARLRAGWLPSAVAGAAVVALLGLAVLNPDRYIADQNITRWQATGRIDTGYLNTLSADTVPALVGLPAQLRACSLLGVADELWDEGPDGWPETNLARARARTLVTTWPFAPASTLSCGDEFPPG